MQRKASKVDLNHAQVVRALRAVGATVVSLAEVGRGCPDLLVGHRGRTLLMEVKSKGGKMTPMQVEWHATWRGRPVVVVWSSDEALEALGVS